MSNDLDFPEVIHDYPPERHAHDAVESIGEILKAESLALDTMETAHLQHALRVLNSILDTETEKTPL